MAIDHFSSSSSVLSCRLYLPPAKIEVKVKLWLLKLLLLIPGLFSMCSDVTLYFCGIKCKACLTILRLVFCGVCPRQFHFLRFA